MYLLLFISGNDVGKNSQFSMADTGINCISFGITFKNFFFSFYKIQFINIPYQDLGTCFAKKERRHCYNDPSIVINTETLLEAISTCSSNGNCEKVYDFECDGIGPFMLCSWGSDEHLSDHLSVWDQFYINKLFNKSWDNQSISSSCIYVKDITQGNMNFLSMGI